MRTVAALVALIVWLCLSCGIALAQSSPRQVREGILSHFPNLQWPDTQAFRVNTAVQAGVVHMGMNFSAPSVDLSIQGADLWVGIAGLEVGGKFPVSFRARLGGSARKEVQVFEAEDPTFPGGLIWDGSKFSWVFGDLELLYRLGAHGSILCGFRAENISFNPIDPRLRSGGPVNVYSAEAATFDLGGGLIVNLSLLDARTRAADFRSKLWVHYIGIQVEGTQY